VCVSWKSPFDIEHTFELELGIMNAMAGGGRVVVRATIGFAVDERGDGIAYALLGAEGSGGAVVRVPFRCSPAEALRGRDVSYAALRAVAEEVRGRGVRHAVFAIEDERLIRELDERLPVPGPLALPYVSLRCALNRFSEATVVVAGEPAARDLAGRARAEVSLHVAA
jgi:hypothetical protein